MRIIRLSWEDIEKDCRVVSKKIMMDCFRIDICVAISRGGFPPARIICDLLNVTSLTSIAIRYYTDIDKILAKPMMVFPLNVDVAHKNVLIVDDVADRGDSLLLAKTHIQDSGASEIRLAALHYKPWSRLKPDYYAHEYRSWIMYPWERAETSRRIKANLFKNGKHLGEIRAALRKIGIENAEIRVPPRRISVKNDQENSRSST